ncbi:MAG: TRC40/GET3/ArsA family transport-energizing ATPase, partial [Anaerolineae bacterium]
MITKTGPSFLDNEELRLIVFCGKGGVGKTTSAAATAMYLAKLRPEKKTLAISTDPAHSLGDSLDYPLGPESRPIPDVPNLWALEVDTPGLLEHFKRRHRREIDRVIARAGIIHQVDVKEFLSLSLPEMDQMLTFIEIARWLKANWFRPADYDLIIIDTPPTGHLAKLLSVLETRAQWIEVFNAALDKYLFFNRKQGGFVDEFVEYLKVGLETVEQLFKNGRETEFVPVTIPEAMSIAETEDLLAALEEKQMPVRNIIVNRTPQAGGCALCSPRAEGQRGPVEEIEEKFGRYKLIFVPLFWHEIRGEEGLSRVGETLSGTAGRYRATTSIAAASGTLPVDTATMADLLEKDLQFVLFSGKGGVGKTSMAAATSL